mmetsp:Transcript_27479/g.85513  ORF Transcript_27479/g.85513 Transcript_27479/m.85513 type:complete len:523 (+) Transcript_27479:57-1625(+)
MGQTAGVGCSFGTLHLCASEDAQGGPLVLPLRCSGASGSRSTGKVARSYSLDLAPDSWQPGSSSFGTAVRAVHRDTGELQLLRVVPKRRCDRERMLRELEALRALDHPNLARVCDVVEDVRAIWLVMELVPGEDLLCAVVNSCQPFTEWFIARLMRQLLLGLQHLHSAGLAHKDVQPRNILVFERPLGQDLRVKLIDYGLAGKYAKVPPPIAFQCCHCLAPEQISGSISPRTVLMEPSCDLWADSIQLLRKKIRTGLWAFLPTEAWTVSDQAKSFVASLLAVQSGQRPAAAQALEHPFLRLDALDKQALQPLARGQEVVRSLKRLNGWRLLQHAVVSALATRLHAKGLAELRQHLSTLDASGKGGLTLLELRRGLVRAGVALPGRLLGALSALEGEEGGGLRGEDLVEAAAERRRGLEEAVLWAAWSTAAPEAPPLLRREEALRLLSHSAPTFSALLGTPAAGPVEPQLPLQVAFDDLLRWLQDAAYARHDGSLQAMWLRLSAARLSAADLAIRIPAAQEFA